MSTTVVSAPVASMAFATSASRSPPPVTNTVVMARDPNRATDDSGRVDRVYIATTRAAASAISSRSAAGSRISTASP